MKTIQLDESFIFDLLDLCKAVGWLQEKTFMKKQFEMYFSLGTLIGYMHDNKLIATGGVFPFKDSFSLPLGFFKARHPGDIAKSLLSTHSPKTTNCTYCNKSWRASLYIMRISNSNDDSSF